MAQRDVQRKLKQRQFEASRPKLVDLVYPLNRYYKAYSPFTMYLPSRTLLFKMMKACCGCKTIDDLWIIKAGTRPTSDNEENSEDKSDEDCAEDEGNHLEHLLHDEGKHEHHLE